jgi:tripeptidyl-peptidase I
MLSWSDLTAAYQKRECAEYGKLGLMGTTFLFASGDAGVAGNFDFCIEPNGTQSLDGIRFNPGYPGRVF